MDLDQNGVCGNVADEIIRYEYDVANLRLNRESITCTAGVRSPLTLLSFLGPITGQPEVRTVEVANGALPVFRYFDGLGVRFLSRICRAPYRISGASRSHCSSNRRI